MDIPTNWTFKSTQVAKGFDSHVREQLPWYDLATAAVAHIARHYIPQGGLVYDIGASTGNVGNAIRDVIEQRGCKLVAIEESREMAAQYKGPGELVIANACEYEYEMFDFAVCFLVLMFFPVSARRKFLQELRSRIKPGGCICVVDKVVTPGGYAGTVLRRMAMRWKLDNGAEPDAILRKELSLAGYQRPLDPSIIDLRAIEWFRFGEFCGWLIERPE